MSLNNNNNNNNGRHDNDDDGGVTHNMGLFRDFDSAATLVKEARSKLSTHLLQDDDDDYGVDGDRVVTEYYNLLDRVERHQLQLLQKSSSNNNNYNNNNSGTKNDTKNINKFFLIEVEGLDGSGKTTLVQGLANKLGVTTTKATKTPSPCLKAIRPLWDHLGGLEARAFYTLSNYILQYEIMCCYEKEENSDDLEIVIIDRWYASTCAYTLADQGLEVSDIILPSSNKSTLLAKDLLDWPKDLVLRPHILLVLNVDPKVRNARVEARKTGDGNNNDVSPFNPWDDRLAKEMDLGGRILDFFLHIQAGRPSSLEESSTSTTTTTVLNANQTTDQVLEEALKAIQPSLERFQKNKCRNK